LNLCQRFSSFNFSEIKTLITLCLDQEDIDIAPLGRGFLASTSGFGIDIIRNHIKPDHVVLMHIHHESFAYCKHIAEQVKEEFRIQ
jgi:hypothetical protein